MVVNGADTESVGSFPLCCVRDGTQARRELSRVESALALGGPREDHSSPMGRAARGSVQACRLSRLVVNHQRFTVSVVDLRTFASSAEMVTFVLFEPGRLVETVNVALVVPAGTVMLIGTAAILG